MDQNLHRDFTQSDQFTDIVMVVEGNKLYAHRMLLAEYSGVWRRLFVSEMTGDEPDTVEFPLEDEKLDEIIELLQCIYSTQKQITGNVLFWHNQHFGIAPSEDLDRSWHPLRITYLHYAFNWKLMSQASSRKWNLKSDSQFED